MLRSLPRDEHFDLVMAVPMHWIKEWKRGFNQAELLAAPVARHLGLKVSRNLRRTRRTASQATLSSHKRQENLKDSFAVRRPDQLVNKRVLLVDDVFTTGATLRTASAVLRQAGAVHISALTLARVDRRSEIQNFASSAKRLKTAAYADTEAAS